MTDAVMIEQKSKRESYLLNLVSAHATESPKNVSQL